MANAKQFLEAIEREKLVPDDVLVDLYEEYRAGGEDVTADALAERLVAGGALSQRKAQQLLTTASDSFVQVTAASLSDTGTTKPEPKAPFADDPEAAAAVSGGGRRKHVKKKHKNDLDSPLLLIGGGALALLVLGGIGMLLVMNLQSGDELFKAADDARKAGSYSQASEQYEEFVEEHTGHALWSEARVKLATVRVRQLVEGGRDWRQALTVAQTEIPQVEDEEAFPTLRAEFAALLPRIARGLAEGAERLSESDPNDAQLDQLVGAAQDALTLVGNTKYVPKSLRDQRDIEAIEELLNRVGRRREAAADLDAAIEKIAASTAAGDVAAAYATHDELLIARPELRDDARLAESLTQAVAAERASVRSEDARAPSAAAEAESSVALALPLATPRRKGAASADGVYVTLHRGTVYAVQAADGALKWRRHVGESLNDTWPVQIDGDLLLVDHRRGELLRVSATDGKLRWRTPIAPPSVGILRPTVNADRVFVPTGVGELWAFDRESGERLNVARFAQPLWAAPAASDQHVYALGRQSSLYTLDAKTLECVAVKYTAHRPGTATTPPVFVDGRVLFIHNTGVATSQLTVFATEDNGAVGARIAEWRLEGIVSTPIKVDDRRLLVVTDSGSTYVFEITPGASEQPLSLIAQRTGSSPSSQSRHATNVRGEVWVAGEGLRRASASLADSTLITRPLTDPCDGDQFVGAIDARGDAVLHARVRAGRSGVTVAASDRRSGALVWETDLAEPLLSAPIVSSNPRGVVAATVGGAVHVLGPNEIRSRLSASPFAMPAAGATTYDHAFRAGPSAVVLARNDEAEWTRVTLSARDSTEQTVLAGELATTPVASGAAIVAALRVGQVQLLDASGAERAVPFQPTIPAGGTVSWTAPAFATIDSRPHVVLSDGESTIYSLSIERAGGSLALQEVGSVRLDSGQPATQAAIVGDFAAIGLQDGRLAIVELPTPGEPRFAEPRGPAAWGPHAAGEAFLVASDGSTLSAVSPAGDVVWEETLRTGPLVGAPLLDGGDAIIASADGRLLRIDMATGQAKNVVDLGQPLASGATAYSSRLLLSAADGTVLVVAKP